MANEITVNARLQVTKTYLKTDENPGSLNVTMTGNNVAGGVQVVGTGAHEALSDVSDIGTPGWAYFRNLDSANFVEVGRDSGGTFVPFAKLLFGEFAIAPLSSDAIYAKADTASVRLYWRIFER